MSALEFDMLSFKSFVLFLFVFTFLSNTNAPNKEEAEQLRRDCITEINTAFNELGNNGHEMVKYAFNEFTEGTVFESTNAKDYYKYFEDIIYFSELPTVESFCRDHLDKGISPCTKYIRKFFGGKPKEKVKYIMYYLNKEMLFATNENGRQIYRDYMVTFWNILHDALEVQVGFQNPRVYCILKYEVTES